MIKINDKIKEVPTEKMTETQNDNWLNWDGVVSKYDELVEDVKLFSNNKEINKKQYEKLLELMVLALYRWIPPRRSEYSNMMIVKKLKNDLSINHNYLGLNDKKFLFNKYKTSSKYGAEIIDIPADLMNIIYLYLKFHPLFRSQKYDIPFLIYHNSEPFNNVNSITRILNKVFGKKISSSMLRHIWNTHEYGSTIKSMKKNADKMGHSLEQAISYIKDDSKVKPTKNKIEVAFT
jgi:hypothetical protein